MSINFNQAIDLNNLPLVNHRMENLAAAPANPALGRVYYNLTTNLAYFWNGDWKPVAGTNIVVVSSMPATPVANTLYIVTT